MFLSFDCYGTLIDWEAGILDALRPVLRAHGVSLGDDALLATYGRLESEAEAGAYRPYREVLAAVMDGFGREFGFAPNEPERAALADSIQDWLPFPDTVPALRRLAAKFKLVILSNIDRDLVQGSLQHLEVPFQEVITAEEVRSYKPALRNFEYLQEKLQINGRERLIHAAQSLYHDIAPARALGIPHVWVNRRKGKSGSGATPVAHTKPEREVSNLAELADLLLG